MTQTISDAANQRMFQNSAAPNPHAQYGLQRAAQNQQYSPLQYMDPTSKLAAAITDHATAIRELADVLYHINTED